MIQHLIVGVDPSITSLGLCIHKIYEHRTEVKTYKFGYTLDKQQLQRGDRHRKIAGHIEDVIVAIVDNEKIVKSVIVVFENYTMGGNSRSTCMLAELAGYLKSNFEMWFGSIAPPVKIIEIPPTSLKKFIFGHGGASKQEMMNSCYEKYAQSFIDDNECDAYCLTEYAIALMKADEKDPIRDPVKLFLEF